MSKSKARAKKPQPYFYEGPAESRSEKEDENETEDLYNTEEREKMLDEDEITAAEAGFMRGRDQAPSKKVTRKNAISHDDSIADELAKEDSEED